MAVLGSSFISCTALDKALGVRAPDTLIAVLDGFEMTFIYVEVHRSLTECQLFFKLDICNLRSFSIQNKNKKVTRFSR